MKVGLLVQFRSGGAPMTVTANNPIQHGHHDKVTVASMSVGGLMQVLENVDERALMPYSGPVTPSMKIS